MITLRDGDGRVVARAMARPPRSLVWLCGGGAYEVDESGYLADDFVGLDPASGRPGCVTPPASPRLLEASRAHLGPKGGVWSEATTRSRLGAIFLMERGDPGEAPSIDSVKPSAAFSLVLAHAHDAAWDELGRKRRDVTFFLRLASSVPALRLRFAHAFDGLERLLDLVEAAMGRIEVAEKDAGAKASTP